MRKHRYFSVRPITFSSLQIGDLFIFAYEMKEFKSRRTFVDHVILLKKTGDETYSRNVPVDILFDKRKKKKYHKTDGYTINNAEVIKVEQGTVGYKYQSND